MLARIAGILSGNAWISLSERFFEAAAGHIPRSSEAALGYVRNLGVMRFMQGKIRDAFPCFAEVAGTKHILRTRMGVPSKVRILGNAWFVALGHLAAIDFLLKKQKLGWESEDTVFFSPADMRGVPGQSLLRELEGLGVRLTWPEKPATTFDRLVEIENRTRNAAASRLRSKGSGSSFSEESFDPRRVRTWDLLESAERASLIEEFWEMSFPGGEGLPYWHAAAKIQNRWEAENRPPLFAAREEFSEALRILRRQLGIPKDAWHVCLHVRESGYHGRWNNLWEQARDADIRTYADAIRAIVARGGYVVRMGDPTMSLLEPMEGVVDCTHSDYRSDYADLILLSGAKFFIGTNSGLSLIPGVYGVPCVLTNWVPIGLPHWFAKDLMIPKLLRNKDSDEYVSLEEMLGTDLGYVQNPRNLPAQLEFVDNTPEDLVSVVEQMLCELDGEADRVRDRALEDAYFAAAVRHGSHRGSRIGTAFMRKHARALEFSWNEAAPEGGSSRSPAEVGLRGCATDGFEKTDVH